MANQFDVHVVNLPVVLTGDTEIPLMKLPSGGGGITVLEANFIVEGTAQVPQLVTMTDAGTPAISGTIGTNSGTPTVSATVPVEFTISDGFVDAGEWIGYDQTDGTVTAGAFITLSYVMGK